MARRKKPGRPRLIPGGKLIPVRLTPAQRETARQIGDGNLSEGVRRLLDTARSGVPRSTITKQGADMLRNVAAETFGGEPEDY